jgi:hypothetical protein
VWIKLTYSEEAWRLANNSTPTDRYGYINSTYSNTRFNTELPKDVVIEDVGVGRMTGSTGIAYVITKTDHGITPGDTIYIKGLSQPFNGTWITSSTATFSDVITDTYDFNLLLSHPLLYLKFESTTITDSGASSATFNSGGNIVSAAGTSTSAGYFGNTVVSPTTSYTLVTGSTSSLPAMALLTDFSVEFWHKGSSNTALTAIDIIRKLPSNLISNSNFDTNVFGWEFAPDPEISSFDQTDRSFKRDTNKKLSGNGSGKFLQQIFNMPPPESASSTASVYYGRYGSDSTINVTAGETYTLSGFINWTEKYAPGSLFEILLSPASVSFTAAIEWQNSGGSIISSSIGNSASLAPDSWYRISASGVAPTGAETAKVTFIKGQGYIDSFNIDNTLFEKSASVNDYTGWAVQRYSNDSIKFQVYSYRGTGARIIVPNMYDDEWHHLAFRGSLSTGDLRISAFVDGKLYGSASGTMDSFGESGPDYPYFPIRINHSINSGIRDNIAIFDKVEPNNGILERYKTKSYFPEIPENRALMFYYNQDNNPVANFVINSYVYDNNDFTFSVDSTELFSESQTFKLLNFKPTTGSTSFSSTRFIITSIDSNNTTTFSASPYGSSVSGKGMGYGGYGLVISSYPMFRSLSPTAQPIVGTAVTSEFVKAFITSFDYTINKRFSLTDYVDVSIEFTEI